MARIKINSIDDVLFAIHLQVRIADVNYGGHLGNDKVLTYAQESRVQFLAKNNLSELNIGEGVGLIMSDAAVAYKTESFVGDVLSIKIGIEDISKFGFDFIYEFKNQKGELVAQVKTGMVCFNYELKKVSRVPEGFKTIINHG